MTRLSASLMVAAACVTLPAAQSVPAGPEFPINTYTTGNQGFPSIASDAFGNFVVVWQSFGQDGDADGIFGRRFDSAGAPISPEFQINTFTTGGQMAPSVAATATGAFVVVWSSPQDGDGPGIFAQRFDAAGAKAGAEIQVNVHTTSAQMNPRVALDISGNFVVAWESYGQDGDGAGIFARRFDRSGSPRGSEFQVNSYTTFDQSFPSIASDPSGSFVVVWESYGQDGDGEGVFGRRYDGSGAPLGGEFQVNASPGYQQIYPSVAMDAVGGFAVVWRTADAGVASGLDGRVFDRTGAAGGAGFEVSAASTVLLAGARISSDASGNFVVAWTNLDAYGYGVAGRTFDAAGTMKGAEFRVNTNTLDGQGLPDVVMTPVGNFTVAWAGYSQDGSGSAVVGRRFTCTDVDLDGICDLQDVVLTSPAALATLDCSDPRTIRPTIEWDAGNFDRFRVFIGSDPGFAKGTRVTSGSTLLKASTYTPPIKKWRSACSKAVRANGLNPILFIRILGVDVDVPKSAPNRMSFSQVVQAGVSL